MPQIQQLRALFQGVGLSSRISCRPRAGRLIQFSTVSIVQSSNHRMAQVRCAFQRPVACEGWCVHFSGSRGQGTWSVREENPKQARVPKSGRNKTPARWICQKVEEIKRQQDGPASSEIGLLCVVFLRLHSFAFGHAHVFGMDPNISQFDYDDSFQCFLQVSHPNVIPNDPNISGEALEAVVAGSCSAHGRHAAAIQAWHGTLHKDA